jgi:hybrid cluster-associated redox disulfide protein
MDSELDEMTVEAIMTRWPCTIRVFIDRRLHCVGCPIGDFHRIADSAREHGYGPDGLKHAIREAIARGR